MKNEKGISLIVLVITIIVMVILAGAVIITLENTNLIKHSKQATNKTNYAQELTRLEVIKNGILTDNLGKITLDEYVTELTNKGIVDGNVTDNADGSKTVKTTSGAEVKLTQDGPRNILIEIAGYTEGNNTSSGNNQSGNTSQGGSGSTTNIITFTIEHIEAGIEVTITQEAEEGMTWGEWVESSYNTSEYGFEVYNNKIKASNLRNLYYGGIAINQADVIINGNTYYTDLSEPEPT